MVNPNGWASISASTYHMCGLSVTSTITCWGNSQYWGSTSDAQFVRSQSSSQGIYTGPRHTCARLLSGAIAW
jgi:hypothetical protein